MAQSTSHKDFHKNPVLSLGKAPKDKTPIHHKTLIDKVNKTKETVCELYVGYRHPVGDAPDDEGKWKTKAGPARFKICESIKPRGIAKKKGMIVAFTQFETRETHEDGTPNPNFEEIRDVAETMEHSRTLCYVKDSDVKVKAKVIKVQKDTKLYSEPDDGSDVLFEVKKGNKLAVPDMKKIPKEKHLDEDSEWVLCYYGGRSGFLERLKQAAAALVFQHRDKINVGTVSQKTEEEILDMFSEPIFWKKNEDGSQYIEDRAPTAFFNVKYFEQFNSYAKFLIPGVEKNEEVSLDFLATNGFTSTDIIKISTIFVGAGRCKIRWQIDAGMVTDIFEAVEINEFADDMENSNVNRSEMAEKLMKARENAKMRPTLSEQRDDDEQEEAQADEDTVPRPDMDILMKGGTVKVKADADEEADSDVEVN